MENYKNENSINIKCDQKMIIDSVRKTKCRNEKEN